MSVPTDYERANFAYFESFFVTIEERLRVANSESQNHSKLSIMLIAAGRDQGCLSIPSLDAAIVQQI